MSNKITERQQIKVWLDENNIDDCSEDILNEIFQTAMEYKNTYPNATLKQSYNYAYMVYMDKHITTSNKNA